MGFVIGASGLVCLAMFGSSSCLDVRRRFRGLRRFSVEGSGSVFCFFFIREGYIMSGLSLKSEGK